jgi:chromosome segregation ATPase
MCAHADKFYGVIFHETKKSHIVNIQKEDAFEFLEAPAAEK